MSSFDGLHLPYFRDLFESICEEMGTVLERAAFSPNIKERRDFSCALFDSHGDCIAQASHIPVHLGSARHSIKASMALGKLKPGDMIVLNDPYQGGTHLPDLTCIQPVFDPHTLGKNSPLFYLLNRAHHSDIGGKSPGSLPLVRTIEEEGLCIAPTFLMRQFQIQDSVHDQITQASRTPEERKGDLNAQISANKMGQQRLHDFLERYGSKELKNQAKNLQNYSEAMLRQEIQRIPDGEYAFEDYIEGISLEEEEFYKIVCKIKIQGDQAKIDFSGTHAQTPSPLNTVYAVTEACILYVFRALAEEDYPVNAGCLRPLDIQVPSKSLIHAQYPSAVSAGNVETSQRIVDVLLGALSKAIPNRIPSASCGSMNNICIGGDLSNQPKQFTYYETVAGGQGARLNHPGQDGIHMHMTNTQNTPIEALENAFPFRIQEYSIRHESGGKGTFAGGNGIRRVYEILSPCEVTLVTDRRLYPPYGIAGGGDAKLGENILIRNEEMIRLPGKTHLTALPGDMIILDTPGGGGYGKK